MYMEKEKFEKLFEQMPTNIKETELISFGAKKVFAALWELLLHSKARDSKVIYCSNKRLREMSGVKTSNLLEHLKELSDYELVTRKVGSSRIEGKPSQASEYVINLPKLKEPITKKVTGDDLLERLLEETSEPLETPMGTPTTTTTTTTTSIPTSTTTSTTTTTSIPTSTTTSTTIPTSTTTATATATKTATAIKTTPSTLTIPSKENTNKTKKEKTKQNNYKELEDKIATNLKGIGCKEALDIEKDELKSDLDFKKEGLDVSTYNKLSTLLQREYHKQLNLIEAETF